MGFWQPARRSSPPCRSPPPSPSMTDNRFPRPTRVYLFAADFQLSEFLAPRHPSGFAPLPESFSSRPTSTHENGGRQRRVRTHRSHHLATGAQELPARQRAIGCWPRYARISPLESGLPQPQTTGSVDTEEMDSGSALRQILVGRITGHVVFGSIDLSGKR